MFKKFFSLLICAVIAMFSFCGCKDNSPDNGKLKIVTAIFPAYDLAREVFGDKADITLLLKPGTESHSYDPSAKDIVKINNCDLFIYNGGESDEWIENILNDVDEINTLRMMDAVNVLEEEDVFGREEDKNSEETEYDEHIWTSPKNAERIVSSICEKASELFPDYSAEFEKNAKVCIDKINDLDKRFEELLLGEDRYFVFGDRFPLLYFFKEYDLNYYAAFPGCNSETEPSAQIIAFLDEKLKEEDTIKTVFCIELSNHKLAQTLADEHGLDIAEFHSCHNISADDFSEGESYISLMERNYEMLKKALGK